MTRQARILLLCDDRRGHANTVLDHIDAFRRFSRHQVRTFNPKAMKRSLALDLGEFDVVVIHYSVVPSDPHFIAPHFRDKLRRFGGLKVQFIQDDYRWVDRATAASRDIGINVLFTIAPEPAAGQLYDERLTGVRRVQTLTGYVPDSLKNLPIRALRDRTLDVGYRARDLPFWYGRLSREKAWIGQRFLELAGGYRLRCDIAWQEQDRIYGRQWIEFMSSCRATLGTESGASIADFDGSSEQSVRAYLRAHPGASYEEVDEAVLRPYEGNVTVNVVSPRVFEAASLGTAMVMFPGQYSGVVRAGEHYIPLEKDFSNMDEVVDQLRDDQGLQALTKRAYDDLIASGRWSYQTFVAGFDRVIEEEATIARGAGAALRWRAASIERSLVVPGLRVRLFRGAHSLWRRVFRRDESLRFDIEYESQIQKALFTMRIVLADRDMRLLPRLARRAGAPLDRFLPEIMDLSLLREAATGRLRPAQSFTLDPVYDLGRKALCFVSTPNGRHTSPGSADPTEIHGVLDRGEVKVIEWDHRAMGGMIHLDRPAMDVGIGFEGLENFTVLAMIGRQDRSVLERVLAPALPVAGAEPAVNSVG